MTHETSGNTKVGTTAETTAETTADTSHSATEYRDGPMNWDHPQPFTLAVVPQADDIDGLNHTNNAVYVRWCADIGWAHSEALGLVLADYRRIDRAMVIRRAEYDYLRPTALHDELVLATWLLPDGDRSTTIDRRFQLVRRRDDVTILRGRWNLACIELSSGRARRLPPEFSQAYLAAGGSRR